MNIEIKIASCGTIFRAYVCSVCGARDTDPQLLAVHERRHDMHREQMAKPAHAGVTYGRIYPVLKKCAWPEGCERWARTKGMCQMHYERKRKHQRKAWKMGIS